MKNLLIIILFFVTSSAVAQKTKKEIKLISKEIENSYLNQDYSNVILLSEELIEANSIVKPIVFEHVLDANFALHDLDGSLESLWYFHFLESNSNSFKKMTDLSKKRVADLVTIAICVNSLSNDQQDKGEAFKEMVMLGPGFWKPYCLYGLHLYKNNLYQDAIINFEKALELKNDIEGVKKMLQDSYFQIGDYSTSNKYVSQLLEEQGDSLSLYSLQAKNYYYLNEYELCLEALSVVMKKEKTIDNYLMRYDCQESLDNIRGAYWTIFEVMKLDPSDGRYFPYLKLMSEELLLRDNLKISIDSLINSHPDEISYYDYRMELYDNKSLDDFDKFITDFDNIIRLDSANYFRYYLAGRYVFKVNLGDNRSKERNVLAREYLDKSIELNPYHFESYDLLVRMHMWRDREISEKYKKLAIVNFKKRIEEFPNDSVTYFYLGQVFDFSTNGYGSSNRGRDSTLVYYHKALLLGYDSLEVLEERRHVHRWRKNYEECLEDNYWVLERAKSEYLKKNCYYSIANAHRKLNEFDQEKLILEKLLFNFPEEKDDRNYKRMWKAASEKVNDN